MSESEYLDGSTKLINKLKGEGEDVKFEWKK